jgi:hypothetical protein
LIELLCRKWTVPVFDAWAIRRATAKFTGALLVRDKSGSRVTLHACSRVRFYQRR